MAEFKAIVAGLDVKTHHYMPGEHDAALDGGAAFRESFGRSRYSFEHQGIRFVVLDDVSDPEAKLGDAQLDWLRRELRGVPVDAPIVVFTHRPLFDLAPQWDWATADGAAGFPLAGGRLDYVAGREVAALVYPRRQHVINVFVWPQAGGAAAATGERGARGYTVLGFTRGGLAYWLVSDVSPADLR